ncbi:SH3 domain-containing protein [Streptomyces sp. ADMS]|uniref:SH3 domain-containing protein n=1 Tax=Streptomyces sp. ADMS TaxID=3071415 RepID=UPI00296FEE64|nr:SH3 domain-containing protein [Streptomyces sp. ADMS]MDW4903903.1 SH3 domain-containing protein [Streptomyces sp. ADMS]
MITKSRSRLTRSGLVAAVVTALAVPVVVVVTAGPASSAAYCGRTVGDKDNRSWPRQTSGVSANQRSGSSTDCGVTGYADNRNVLDYHCWTAGDGGTWTYLRNDTDGSYGWVKDTLLPDGGSNIWCEF